ncbi:uncharacterized protein LOC129788809 [Lutzomyia longipalpis]|uniref:uncharacterized protein LOC129788809 n=1 Tax=Lutzomyia longipalpis TaxID=7200 RepID=UPI00248413F8|nr:uncharacterized protein LOC129788809 [Lutzomyia longipalpis]
MPNLPNNMDNVTVTMIQRNLYVLNGYLDITKDINVPVALSMDVKRCTLDKTHCEDYDSLTITKLCGKLKDAKALWAPMIESIQPTPLCPVKHGIYRMTNATANLAVVSRLPLDGYRWVVRFTVHQDGDKKKILICLDAEVSITNQKRRHE